MDFHHVTATEGDDCLMCAVRALTEGAPAVIWRPTEQGQSISGVVLRIGMTDGFTGPVPFVDLWTGGTGRVRVLAAPATLAQALHNTAPMVGDRLEFTYEGKRTVAAGKNVGREYQLYQGTVMRGHHV